jgi:hypothetical protein
VLVVEVLIAQRPQNSAVLTYSENGAMFPITEWDLHFVSQTKKYRTRVVKKNRHLTKKKEQEERGQESKKPGIDPTIIEESRAASAARVPFHEPCHAMDGVRDTPMISNDQSVSASVRTIDPVVGRKAVRQARLLR